MKSRWLLIAGIIEAVAGLSHFALPHFAYQSKGFSLLDQNEVGFVTAGVFSVGILLMTFGSLTVYLSLREDTSTEVLLYYAITQSILWLMRIVIEIAYPIKIHLFLINQPTVILLPLFIFEFLLFTTAAMLIYKKRPSNSIQAKTQTAGSR
jgi:hypothetical protein